MELREVRQELPDVARRLDEVLHRPQGAVQRVSQERAPGARRAERRAVGERRAIERALERLPERDARVAEEDDVLPERVDVVAPGVEEEP